MSLDYNQYLKDHKQGVTDGLMWLANNLTGLDQGAIDKAIANVEWHDKSKFNPAEYDAYDDYFYGGNRTSKVKEAFDYAWLHHIHNNPHHWQYWVLINDDADEGTRALEMPLEYVYEMIADWWSFSWKKGNLMEIFDWYDDHKSRIIFHKNTKQVVESILDGIKAVLKMQQRKEQPSKAEDEDETVEELAFLDEDDNIEHSGTKGMKWGERNGPPYPINRIRYGKSQIIKNELDSGKIKSKIDTKKQDPHVQGNTYVPGKSYIYGDNQDAQRLVNKLAGTGLPIMDKNGNWSHKERVINNEPIGVSLSRKTGKDMETNEATIHYSKSGTHIVPRDKKYDRKGRKI